MTRFEELSCEWATTMMRSHVVVEMSETEVKKHFIRDNLNENELSEVRIDQKKLKYHIHFCMMISNYFQRFLWIFWKFNLKMLYRLLISLINFSWISEDWIVMSSCIDSSLVCIDKIYCLNRVFNAVEVKFSIESAISV